MAAGPGPAADLSARPSASQTLRCDQLLLQPLFGAELPLQSSGIPFEPSPTFLAHLPGVAFLSALLECVRLTVEVGAGGGAWGSLEWLLSLSGCGLSDRRGLSTSRAARLSDLSFKVPSHLFPHPLNVEDLEEIKNCAVRRRDV